MNIRHLFQHVVATLTLGACILAPALAARGPTTPDEEARIVQIAAAADKDPVGVMTSPDGRWFQKWADDAPDYSFGPDKGVAWIMTSGAAKGDFKRIVRFHHDLSAAAFQVQHHIGDPRKSAADMDAKTLAGVEGLLRAYESFVATHPDVRTAQMDSALAARNAGALAAFVTALPPMPAR
jgi:hypothetical protein